MGTASMRTQAEGTRPHWPGQRGGTQKGRPHPASPDTWGKIPPDLAVNLPTAAAQGSGMLGFTVRVCPLPLAEPRV